MTTTAAGQRLVALVGNPNVGKSTLFNALTGMRQRVANYPGVTVDAREGTLTSDGGQLRLLDLPGTYSLRPSASDEAIVERVLLGREAQAPDVVVVILDASNLRRNLFLLTEVLDLGLPTVAVLNMVDEARRAGVDVPSQRLSQLTGISVVETVASKGEGLERLREALDAAAVPKRVWCFNEQLEARFEARAGETPWQRLRSLADEVPGLREQEVAGRYAWINEALMGASSLPQLRQRTEQVDRYLLHPVWGPLVFITVMGLVFQSIFGWAGPIMEGIEGLVAWVSGWAGALLLPATGELFTSLITDGVIAGVGAVVVFLPQIVILFLILGLLEDTGYMARAAFLVDRPLQLVGLSGRSFIPLLSSFACAVPGVMATRTIPSRAERLLAIAVAPLMTCSARLPVYILLIAAFVPAVTVAGVFNLQGLILFGLYLAGIMAGVGVAFLLSRGRLRRGKLLPLVVELPPYRAPTLRGVFLKLRVRVGDFLKRAGTVIFAVSVVLWFLMTFPRVSPAELARQGGEPGAIQLRQSYAGRLGRAIEPAIRPLGYDWKIGVGLIASFAAREVFVGTMGVIYSVEGEVSEESQGLRSALQAQVDPETGEKVYSLPTVFSLLAFYVFALQCGATLAVVRRETKSWKFVLAQLGGYLLLAYLTALLAYQGLTALGVN